MAVHRTRSSWHIDIDLGQLGKLERALKIASPAAATALRKDLRAARSIVVEEAKRRASFSTRIPGSIIGKGNGTTLRIDAGGSAAPDAAPLENRGKEGKFRHPVFGHDVWVEQQARPFLTPAVKAKKAEIEALVDASIDRILGSI